MIPMRNPYIRHVDGCPTSPSPHGEVNGGDIIRMMLVATTNAPKQRLTSSIPFVNSSTAWTPLRSVIWLNVNYWNTPLQAFVFDHLLQSSESPAVERGSLLFPLFAPLSYSLHPLHHDEVSASDQRINESSANLVQNCIYPSSLPSSQPFKLPKMSPPMLDWLTINTKTIGSYQELVNPNINSYRVTPRRFWNFHQNSKVQIEFPTISSINKLCIPYRILQKFLLVISNSELNLNSSVNCGYGNFILSIPKKCKSRLSKSMESCLNLCCFFLLVL